MEDIKDALHDGDVGLVKRFLDTKGDPNTRIQYDSLLAHALRFNQIGCIRCLLEGKADVSIYRPNTQMNWHAVKYAHNMAPLQLLLDFTPRPIRGCAMRQMMQEAISQDNVFFVKELLDMKVDLHQHFTFGDTILSYTMKYGRLGCTEYLLRRKANPDQRSRSMRTPLQLAIANHRTMAIESLLEAKADVNLPVIINITAGRCLSMDYCAFCRRRGKFEFISILERYGCTP